MGSLNSSVETLALGTNRNPGRWLDSSSPLEGSIATSRAARSPPEGLEPPLPSTAPHQGRRGVGHADQGHDRWRRRHPSHPQVSHRQEGRGPAAPVDNLVCQYFWYFVQTYPQRKTQDMKTDPSLRYFLDMRRKKAKNPMKHRTANVQIFRRGHQYLADADRKWREEAVNLL